MCRERLPPDRYHYLGYQPLPGAQFRCFARAEGRIPALPGFGAAAWKTAPRYTFIGWNRTQRESRLHLVVNNARFLILPWVMSKHLASKLLGMAARLLPLDLHYRYGYSRVLLETFVEKQHFAGTCYTDSGKFLRRERRADQAHRAAIHRSGNEGIYHYPYYKAANCLCVGETQGRGKLDTAHTRSLPLKTVWVHPLSRNFRQLLAR